MMYDSDKKVKFEYRGLKKMICVCCGREVNSIHNDVISEPPEHNMWSKGSVGIIETGYGSEHDGDVFIVCLCDECIKHSVKNNIILYKTNYMGFHSDDMLESGRIMERQIKIDNLING